MSTEIDLQNRIEALEYDLDERYSEINRLRERISDLEDDLYRTRRDAEYERSELREQLSRAQNDLRNERSGW